MKEKRSQGRSLKAQSQLVDREQGSLRDAYGSWLTQQSVLVGEACDRYSFYLPM